MDARPTLGVRTIAIRSLVIGFGTMIISHFIAGPKDGIEIVWPTVLALWIAAGIASFMMAWTRRGLRRWAWALAGTALLLMFAFVSMLTISGDLMAAPQ